MRTTSPVRRLDIHRKPAPAIDKREACPRRALAAAAAERGVTLAALSRMLGRPEGYLGRFVRDGHPRAVRADEHRELSLFFDVDERALGVRQLWVPL